MTTFSFRFPNLLYPILSQIYGCLTLILGTLSYYQIFLTNMLCKLFPRYKLCKVNNMTFLGGFRQKKGDCTARNIYKHLSFQLQVTLPPQGSRSISPQANQILQKMWRQRNLLPLIKTFVRRLIRRALATRESCKILNSHRQTLQHLWDNSEWCSLILPLQIHPCGMVFC